MKKAFTLFELIIVIVILGILASFGVNIALEIYRNYFQARAINTLETQTEITLEQISKRLAYRVKESTIGREPNNTEDIFVSTSDSALTNTYAILEWVNYSYESFQNGGWSGFIDINNPNTVKNSNPTISGGTLVTPGSNLASANTYISDLTRGLADLANGQVGLFFRQPTTNININRAFGYNGTNSDNVAIARSNGATNLVISNYARNNEIYEQYYLLHTAYAVVPVRQNASDTDFQLWLHYNYRPWVAAPGSGTRQSYRTSDRALLAEHVTRFNFTELNGVMVLKLCMRDARRSLDDGAEVTVCKTKAVY